MGVVNLVIEEKETEMVTKSGSNKPCKRIAHFLKPSSQKTQTLINPPPQISSPKKPISQNLKFLTSKIHVNGWKNPLKNWNIWVEKMRILHEPTWRKACIFEAIMGSNLEIPKCFSSIFVLAEKWCPESSSFILPWGEIGVTLEDVMVLGGFSVTGDSVMKEVRSIELLEIEENLHIARLEMFRMKVKKASQLQWMEMWMDNGSEIEHEAFLSLWLSRYVFPADDVSTINKSVFRIAVLLSRGVKLALAPAVLASIYRDLRLLKEKIETLRCMGDQSWGGSVLGLRVWAPLQLLQGWVWERFQTLMPKPKLISDGIPRLARWNKAKIVKFDDVSLCIESAGESFLWRPYTTRLNNWNYCDKLYAENAAWVSSVSCGVDLDLESHVRFIRVSELVGLDCVETYLPHRFSMQFGFDQDVPVAFPRPKYSRQAAWSSYDRPITDVELYMPSRSFEPNVSMQYFLWWRSSKIKQETENLPDEQVENVSRVADSYQGSLSDSRTLAERVRIKVEYNQADVPPGFQPKDKRVESSMLSDAPGSKRSLTLLLPCSSLRKRRSKGPRTVLLSKIRNNDTDTNAASDFSSRLKGVLAENDSDAQRTLTRSREPKGTSTGNLKWYLRKRKKTVGTSPCTLCMSS